jgi:hypothetical protein
LRGYAPTDSRVRAWPEVLQRRDVDLAEGEPALVFARHGEDVRRPGEGTGRGRDGRLVRGEGLVGLNVRGGDQTAVFPSEPEQCILCLFIRHKLPGLDSNQQPFG